MDIVLLVGVCLMAFGFFLRRDLAHSRSSRKVIAGTVKGIELFKNVSKSNGATRISWLYRPIIEFVYAGKTYFLAGTVGSSKINVKINQIVKLYDLGEGPEYVNYFGSSYILMYRVFILVGFCSVLFFFFGLGLSVEDLIKKSFFSLGMFVAVILYLKVKSKKSFRRLDSLKNTLVDMESLNPESTYYWDQGSLLKEQSKYNKFTMIFCGLSIAVGVLVSYRGILLLDPTAQSLLLNNPLELLREENIKYLLRRESLALGVGLYFILMGSLAFIKKKN